MLRVPEPDMVIAERLSGQSPFVATDHFSGADPVAVPPAAGQPAAGQSGKSAPATEGRSPDAKPPAAASPRHAAAESRPSKSKRSDGEIDLSGALGNLDPAEDANTPAAPRSLDTVFKGLRKDAGRGEADQSAQHMKLARTYLEMGMIEEATASLETAARSPRQRFEAASMLGRLFRDQGDVARAIEWFEHAAEAPAPGVEDGRALLYDLGVALEEAGETTRALSVFLELQAEASEYRDVADRADRLARVQAGG
jgi:tetratricopeptide (TPR) repeat protein